jgi:hypothetical protein
MRRRALLSAALAPAFACRRRSSPPEAGLVLVANRDGEAVAVVDLAAFAAIRHIPVKGRPSTLARLPGGKAAVLTPETGTLHRVNVETLAVEASRQVAAQATTIARGRDGAIYVLAERWFIRLNGETLSPDWQLALPEAGVALDLSRETPFAVVSGRHGRLILLDLQNRRIAWRRDFSQSHGPVAFLKNGRLILAGDRSKNRLAVLEPAQGRLVVDLPLSVAPERFCFKHDGGQLFVTGAGLDAVVVVYPFQTQVAGTILAGRNPGVMAASPDLLFVANPDSGEVTVMEIRTHRIRAVVPVGQRPNRIIVTPDNAFALVLNELSGDIAVIRVDAMTGRRTKAAPLFTMIPVGSAPVDAIAIRV